MLTDTFLLDNTQMVVLTELIHISRVDRKTVASQMVVFPNT